MQPKYEINTYLDRKFSFFKKDDFKDEIKLSKKTKLKIQAIILLSFAVFIQFISITQYEKNSVSFQQKTFTVTSVKEPLIASSGKLSKMELEIFLLENLNKKLLSYEDIENLAKTVKINKKEIPTYVYSHILEKLKNSNKDIYINKMNLLMMEFSIRVENPGLIKMLIAPQHKEKNIAAYNKLKYSIEEKYKLMEQKILEIAKK